MIIHRVRSLRPYERIVFVAVASFRRQFAFQACACLGYALKWRAPFWKQKDTPAGRRRWVGADSQPGS